MSIWRKLTVCLAAGFVVILNLVSGVAESHAQDVLSSVSAPANLLRYRDEVFSDVDVTRDVVFGQNRNDAGNLVTLRMDVYTPRGDTAKNRPVMLLAFGGGFVGGSRDNSRLVDAARNFARRGYVVANIDYRLITRQTFNPEDYLIGIFRAMHDMRAAVRFFRADAAGTDRFGTDGEIVIGGGASAGAITAAFTGAFDEDDLISPGVRRFLDANGGVPGNSGGDLRFSSDLSGVFSVAGAVGLREWVDQSMPPVFAAHEEFDPIVPCKLGAISGFLVPVNLAGGCEMVDAAEDEGIPAELKLKRGAVEHVGYSSSEFEEIYDDAAAFFYTNVIQAAQPQGLFASVLPGARSVTTGSPATAFATMLNTSDVDGTNCRISLPASLGGAATLSYRRTNASNEPVGDANQPVAITAGASQGFVIAVTPSQNFSPARDIALEFVCENLAPAPSVSGLNTMLLSSAASQPADMVSIAQTIGNNGIADIPGNTGTGVFAVATVNNGGPDTNITARVTTGGTTLPVSFLICRTGSGGACLAPPAATVQFVARTNAANTFSVFVTGSGAVAFDPARNRAFVEFVQGSTVRGATSVAVRTN